MWSLIYNAFKKIAGPGVSSCYQRVIFYALKKLAGQFFTLAGDSIKSDGQNITIVDVELNVSEINKLIADKGLPVELTDGYIGRLNVGIDMLHILQEPSIATVDNVEITLRSKAVAADHPLFVDGVSNVMSESIQQTLNELNDDPESNTLEIQPEVQQILDLFMKVKSMMKVNVKNVKVRLESIIDSQVAGVDLHISSMRYFERDSSEGGGAEVGDQEGRAPEAWLTTNLEFEGVSLDLDDEAAIPSTPPESAASSLGEMGELFQSALDQIPPEEEDSEQEDVRSGVSPIRIATLNGVTQIKIHDKKATKSLEGPMRRVEGHFGAVLVVLSPKQIEVITSIVTPIVTPAKQRSQAEGGMAVNQPLGQSDYERVTQVLMDQMNFHDVTDPAATDCNFLADGEPMFYTMDPSPPKEMNVSTSSLDTTGTASTRATSEFPASVVGGDRQQRDKEKVAQKERDRAAKAAADPSANYQSFNVSVGALSVCLLHKEPHDGGRKSWVEKMSALTTNFFQRAKAISFVGPAISLPKLRDQISTYLPRDHLGLLCKPVTMLLKWQTVQRAASFSADFSIHSAELIECLYDTRKRSNTFNEHELTNIPQYCELMTFRGSRSQGSNESLLSAVGVKYTSVSKEGRFGCNFEESSVQVTLGNLFTEVDVTIVDRVDSLINTVSKHKQPSQAPLGQSLLTGGQSDEFAEAMLDVGQGSNALKLDIAVPHATLQLRFPIPDLRPADQHYPREWWGRNLHKESLLLEVDHLSLRHHNIPEQAQSAPLLTEVMCSRLEVFFQEDFDKAPILFGSILQGSGDIGDNFNRPRIAIKSFPPTSSLKEEAEPESYTGHSSSDEYEMNTNVPGSSPFSLSKEVLQGTEALHWEEQQGFDSVFEKMSPGNKEEMNIFIDASSSNTSLLVEIIAPKVLVLIKDKPFLELLYNRINNDLLLWEPQRPSPPDNFLPGPSVNVQPFFRDAAPKSSMTCSFHQGLHGDFMQSMDYDSDLEEEDILQGTVRDDQSRTPLPSNFSLSVIIGDGKMFAKVPILMEDGSSFPGHHGELLLGVREAQLFLSDGHRGDAELKYLSFTANRAQLLHGACVDNNRPAVRMEHLEALTSDNNSRFSHLRSRIYLSEQSVPIYPLHDVGTGDMSEDMVSVAVKIKVDSLHNHKHFCVGAALRAGTLFHEQFFPGQSWIQMVMELLNLKDYPIQGYVMPRVLTDLRVELQGCAVDYRPKNFPIPLRSLITAQNFILAVNLNSESRVTPIKMFMDEARFWLSNKEYMEIRLEDYVCLAYVTLLEVSLRVGEASEGGSQSLISLSNSMTELHICADSCSAVTSLIVHFMTQGDLRTKEDQDQEMIRMEEEMERSVHEENQLLEKHKRVEEMMADALEEDDGVDGSGGPEHLQAFQSRPLYFIPEEGQSGQDVIRQEAPATPAEAFEGPTPSSDEESFTVIEVPKRHIKSKKKKNVTICGIIDTPPSRKIDKSSDENQLPPNVSANELQTPVYWPTPENEILVREVNFSVHFYGGNDFASENEPKAESKMNPDRLMSAQIKRRPVLLEKPWTQGGANRKRDFMVKLVVSKLRLNYEVFAEEEVLSQRLVVVVKKVEMEDHLEVSSFNKIAYWPGHDTSADADNFARLKVMWERPDARYSMEECSVMFTMNSVQANLNQDTFNFLQTYLANYHLCKTTHGPVISRTSVSDEHLLRDATPIFNTSFAEAEGGEEVEEEELPPFLDQNLINFEEPFADTSRTSTDSRPKLRRINVDPPGNPLFIKHFRMTRNVMITICYMGTMSKSEGGANDLKEVASDLFKGMVTLENVELELLAIDSHKGYNGFQKLLEELSIFWYHDIATRQFGSLVGGIGPIHILTTLVKGVIDLIEMPYTQYRRDGRVWRGVQKGALSLKKAAQIALFDLLNKILVTVQVCSEYCCDFLSSGKSVRSHQRYMPSQPQDLREGISGAVTIVKERVSGSVRDLVHTASQQHEQKGLAGAAGTIAKTGPAVGIFMPVAAGMAGMSNVISGLRNEINPEIKKREKEKWKANT